MPLRDINAGTGKPPLMTAVPRVGGIMNSTLPSSEPQPRNNQDMVSQLLEAEREAKENSSLSSAVGSVKRGFFSLMGRSGDADSGGEPKITKQDKMRLDEERADLRTRISRIPHGPERARRVASETARSERNIRAWGGEHLIPKGGFKP